MAAAAEAVLLGRCRLARYQLARYQLARYRLARRPAGPHALARPRDRCFAVSRILSARRSTACQ